MSRKVDALVTHDTMFVNGWGNLDKTIPSKSKSVPGLSMVEGLNGIEVSAPGRVTFVVPYAHIKLWELAAVAVALKATK
jgi:hypothetical protein